MYIRLPESSKFKLYNITKLCLNSLKMLFEIEKPRRKPRLLFQTIFWHLGDDSAKTTRTSTIFPFYHGNKFSLIEERGQSVTSFFNSCSLLHPLDFRNADDWFFFFKEKGFILSSPELKAQVSFSDHRSSVVCLSVCL